MRGRIICLFLNLFVCYCAKAQLMVPVFDTVKLPIDNHSGLRVSLNSVKNFDTSRTAAYNTPFVFMASNYYTSSLGFFCKKELEVERTLKFPLKFRLGSVEYTDKMEGKGRGFLQAAAKR